MASRRSEVPGMQHHGMIRNTLLDDLQSILHEYPDNEQIIKELLQNAEDAGARVVKMGFCPSSRSAHLPDPYRRYLSGPALCFYNDSIFEEGDWEGITMVRKSNKQDDPLKVGKFGIGFKSVYHITDTVCVISGAKILFIDPLSELQDSNKVCSIAPISYYVHPNVCGSRGLEPLYNLFGINKATARNGKFKGTFFWFPLRKAPSKLSENTYSPEKVKDLFKSFKEEMSSELLFLTSIEEIGIYKIKNDSNCCESECTIAIDQSCVEKIRNERQCYKEKIRDIEVNMAEDDRWICQCEPVWMKNMITYKIKMDDLEMEQVWFIVQYFHAGSMHKELSNLIRNRRSTYRPYIGVAARLDEPIQYGQLFCFLPLPFQEESPTGLPVHINGFFALDSNRQHLKWPSYDQEASQSHIQGEMLWNRLMVQTILPIVYWEFLRSWRDDSFGFELVEKYLKMFYHYIPRMSVIKNHLACIGKIMHGHLLQSQIPCLESRKWVFTTDAYFVLFATNTHQDVQNTVKDLFERCTNKIIALKGHEDLFYYWRSLHINHIVKSTSPQETRNLLKRDPRYKEILCDRGKGHLLIYTCSDGVVSDLSGIELLPLQNGMYETLQGKRKGPQKTFYLCEQLELEILIGQESFLILNTSTTTEVGKVLKTLACSGYYSFQRLCSNNFVHLLKKLINLQKEKTGDPILVKETNVIFEECWLKKVWDYLKDNCPLSLEPVRDLNLIKTKESEKLKKISDSFISGVGMDMFHIKVLAHFKIWVIDESYHDHLLFLPGKGIVVECTDYGKGNLLQQCLKNGIGSFNLYCSVAEREWFKEFLPVSIPEPLIAELQNLKMFKCFSSIYLSSQIGYTSLKECSDMYVGEMDLPIQFPSVMILPLTTKEVKLLSGLNANKVDLSMCVQKCIDKIMQGFHSLNDEHKRKFCFYVLEKQPILRNWWKIQKHLNSISFIRNKVGKLCSANELYDPNDKLLQELFISEDKFPEEDKTQMDLLSHLQFKSQESPAFQSDVVQTCQQIDSNMIENMFRMRKSNALLYVFQQNQRLFQCVFNSILGCKIIPYKENGDQFYPKKMKWYSSKEKFVSFEMVYSSKYECIIGSVLPLPAKAWEYLVHLPREPLLEDVLMHLNNIIEDYHKDEHVEYCYITRNVYQFLATKTVSTFVSLLPEKCIFTELGFVRIKDVFIERNSTDLNLDPYYIPIPKELSTFEGFFEAIGCEKKQSNYLLIKALEKIREKQSGIEDLQGVNEDFDRVQKILGRLSEFSEDELSQIRDGIIIPIHNEASQSLIFRKPHECAYTDSNWYSGTFTNETKICLIHSKIDKNIARKLGVKSVKKFTLSDAEEIISEFGQSEPLTQRLNRLLEEGYTDGLSVPKELIQNADDAGASEVYFLYDERENEGARSCLLDPGMKGCQGPALWAYNNAAFSPSDFQNIQKLNGATKKEDTTKIGKFGLGFNAVYNLTDVPSFVSGKYLVYLDPHGKYLGEAIVNEKSPGIKLNLYNKTMLYKFEDQFKPYENVFGFKSSGFSDDRLYKGTLFRFPLRTKQQARTSEISSREYSKEEMVKLIKLLSKSCGNMILFTQNVKTIKIFHNAKNSINPGEEMKLIMTVQKKEESQLEQHDMNILAAASRYCCNVDSNPSFVAFSLTNVTVASTGHFWLDKKNSFTENTYWVITWALGHNQSLRLFKENRSDGAFPISSVAVPVEIKNGQITPFKLHGDFHRYGFYELGHLFCFLPLPIKNGMNFHINGSFAVSSDRQRLLNQTEDDKDSTKQTIWNYSLVTDATLEAFISLLLLLKDHSSESYSYFALWPTQSCDTLLQHFKLEFYKAIVFRDLPLFKTDCGWKRFQECIFLHWEMEEDKHLKQAASEILRKSPMDGKTLTEIPRDVYKELENHLDVFFEKHVVTYEKFFIDYFLPNILMYHGTKYDKIVLQAIRSKNKNILTAIQKTDCITTLPCGMRRAPRNLIHPQSSLSGLFVIEDERFPAEIFYRQDDLELLVRLGMMKNEIPWDLLESQAGDVSELSKQCGECALQRSMHIIKYVHRFFPQVPQKTTKKLSNTSFLPVKEKPDGWPVKWYHKVSKVKRNHKKCANHSEKEKEELISFECPCNMFLPTCEHLVGCIKIVLGRYDIFKSYLREIKALGVKSETYVELETLKHQLTEITNKLENAANKIVEDICFDIYTVLQGRVTEPDVKTFIRDNLSNLPCVLTEKTFAFPNQVVFYLPQDCSPFFFGLKSRLARNFLELMKVLGVRNFVDPDDIVDVLLCIKENHSGKKLPRNKLRLVCRIANLLENFDLLSNDNLYLPDVNGYFIHVSELCLDDCAWLPRTESMKFLNTEITIKVAKLVGVKSKREQNIFEESEEFGDAFGQHEDLTNRINRILDGYPENNIMKELLQNADDAGATEMHFIKDFRTHKCDYVFSENWKELQGPALCVFNDSVFTDKDFEGIQNLGIGSKGNDPTSTGQYGVGFNVVYHLTDVPSFLSRDQTTSQDTLCILDPHCKYIPHSTMEKPGRKFKNFSKNAKYKDIMSCYLYESELWASSRGTLFRFPLRSNRESLLSSKLISCEDIKRLLNELKEDMAECLLFLHNVRCITVSSINMEGILSKEFSVSSKTKLISSIKSNLFHAIANVRQQMKKDTTLVCSMERKEVEYYLKINVNEQLFQNWLIVTGVGFQDKTKIPEIIKEAYRERRLALLPTSGIAINIENMVPVQYDRKLHVHKEISEFRAYCFLPLPIQTGLTVHLNGHFALDHEARHGIWWPDSQHTDLKIIWNKTLIKEVIVPTYALAIEHLRNLLFPESLSDQPWDQLDKFHKVFPSMKLLKDKIWQYTSTELYRYVGQHNCKFFPIVRREDLNIECSDESSVKTDLENQSPDKSKSDINIRMHDQQFEVTWTTLQTAFFDGIKWPFRQDHAAEGYYFTYGKSSKKLNESCSKDSEFLAQSLKNLGMLLIETPLWVFSSMKDAGIDGVQIVSPKAVLNFLKTYKTDAQYKCKIEVNIPVKQTRMKHKNVALSLLSYCIRDKDLKADDFEQVPLLITADGFLREFRNERVIYLIDFPELLPRSANLIADVGQMRILKSHSALQKIIKELDVSDFSELLQQNISPSCRACTEQSWNLESESIPNVRWIKLFWFFIAQKFQGFVFDEQIRGKKTNSEREWFQMFSSKVLHLFEKWYLVPAIIKQNEGKNHFLFPLKHGKRVLLLMFGQNAIEQKALIELNLPLLDNTCLPTYKDQDGFNNCHIVSKILQTLTATVTNVEDILDCVFSNLARLCTQCNDSCKTIMKYFAQNLETLKESLGSRDKLAALPLYYSDMYQQCVSVQRKTVIILPEDVPKYGLVEWSKTMNTTFIEEDQSLTQLYQFVGCKVVTDVSFYIQVLLPNFQRLPPETVMFHLSYIKDIVIHSLEYSSCVNAKRQLAQLDGLLRKIPFLPTESGRYARACDFFNPSKDIFKLENCLCLSSELPSKPFDNPEWENFLIHCGMKNEFTPEIFLEFAIRLQNLGDLNGVTSIVLKNSRYLVRDLFLNRTDLLKNWSFVNDLKHVRFICPYQVSEVFTRIVKQYKNCNKLICFRNSTIPTCDKLIWSVMGIISEETFDAIRCLLRDKQATARKMLEIIDLPPVKNVVNHVTNICFSIKDQLPQLLMDNRNEKAVSNVMFSVYEFLQKHGTDEYFALLKTVPFVFIKKREILSIPQRVILDINDEEEILPYLCKAPVFYGQFHSLFRDCGAADTLLCQHLVNVLYEIYQETEGNELEPNEILKTKKAVQQLFSKLKKEEEIKIESVLYFPSKRHNLIQSDKMVFIDDVLIEGRIGRSLPDLEFFVGFDELGMDVLDPLGEINLLPESHRPKLMSKIFNEKMNRGCTQSAAFTGHARTLQNFLRSDKCYFGVIRLVRDELYKNGKSFSEAKQTEIFQKLQRVTVFHVERLETVLMYNESMLPNTEKQKKVFSEEIKDGAGNSVELHIYFKVNHEVDIADLIFDIDRKLSAMLNIYLGDPLKKNETYLTDVLKCIKNPCKIEDELTNLEIMAIDVGHSLRILPFMPELGTEISVSLHHLLNNSCTYIELGTYVAYEVYDPIIDEEEPKNEDTPVYILARIVGLLTQHGSHGLNADAWDMKYKIDVGSEKALVAEASRVYKFVRQENIDEIPEEVDGAKVFTWNIDNVKVYIRNVMRNAFEKSNSEFDRTMKRLILQYHHKNYAEKKDYYVELNKFIHFIEEMLKKGESVNDGDIFDSFNPQVIYPTTSFWVSCDTRVNEYARKHRDYCGSTDSKEVSFFTAFNERGSQPGQAKRWFKQADIDFKAAFTDLNGPNAYNWTCYKCHQAVEKALKALLYQIDANKVALNTHNLSSLAYLTEDVNLSGLVGRLESITGSYFQMRYPDSVPGGYIPSDLYTSDKATKAIEYASEILQTIRQRIPSV